MSCKPLALLFNKRCTIFSLHYMMTANRCRYCIWIASWAWIVSFSTQLWEKIIGYKVSDWGLAWLSECFAIKFDITECNYNRSRSKLYFLAISCNTVTGHRGRAFSLSFKFVQERRYGSNVVTIWNYFATKFYARIGTKLPVKVCTVQLLALGTVVDANSQEVITAHYIWWERGWLYFSGIITNWTVVYQIVERLALGNPWPLQLTQLHWEEILHDSFQGFL